MDHSFHFTNWDAGLQLAKNKIQLSWRTWVVYLSKWKDKLCSGFCSSLGAVLFLKIHNCAFERPLERLTHFHRKILKIFITHKNLKDMTENSEGIHSVLRTMR